LFKSGKVLLLGRASDVPRWPATAAPERVGQAPGELDAPRR